MEQVGSPERPSMGDLVTAKLRERGIDVTPPQGEVQPNADVPLQPVRPPEETDRPEPKQQSVDLKESEQQPKYYNDLVDEEGRNRSPASQSVKEFKEKTGLGQDGVRALQKSIMEGQPITLEEAKNIEIKEKTTQRSGA
jgi:hypothetical protein